MSGIGGFLFNRGEPDLLSFNTREYNGVTYYTRFQVSKAIRLTKVGFFGPLRAQSALPVLPLPVQSAGESSKKDEKERVIVRILARESRFNDLSAPDSEWRFLLSERFCEVDVAAFRGGKVFMLSLPTPGIVVKPNVIIDFGFELQGIDTPDIKFHRLPESHPIYSRAVEPKSGVEFMFVGSSKQMPSFQFDVLEELHDPVFLSKNTDTDEPRVITQQPMPVKDLVIPGCQCQCHSGETPEDFHLNGCLQTESGTVTEGEAIYQEVAQPRREITEDELRVLANMACKMHASGMCSVM